MDSASAAGMITLAQRTVAIVSLAGAVVGGTALLVPTRASPAAQRPSEPAPPPATATGTGADTQAGFKLDAMLGSSHVLAGASDSHMAITLTAPERKGDRRPPLDVAVVLDRSGSMAGEKLEQAKRAASLLLEELDHRDRFSVVVYGSDVMVVTPLWPATPSNVELAQNRISTIADGGGTNLSGGLLAARSTLAEATSDSADRISRVVLISDGKANEGIVGSGPLAQLATETAQSGTSITTVGVGLDYDEQIMTKMAVSGRGNYYFAESASALRNVFAKEMRDLGATVATNVMARITPAPGVSVAEAYGYELRPNADGAVEIPIADLASGDTRKVVLRLTTELGAGATAPIASVGVGLKPTEGATIALSTELAANVTSDVAAIHSHRHAEATAHIERAKTAVAIDRATALYESGRAEEARQTLSRRKADAKQAARAIANKDLEEEMDEASDAAEGNFQKAGWGLGSVGTSAGKRARKKNRSQAFKLAR